MNELVSRVHAKRLQLGLSIREAARLIDIPFQTLARLESGTNAPNKTTARAMHRWVFDISGDPLPEPRTKTPRWTVLIEGRLERVEERLGLRKT